MVVEIGPLSVLTLSIAVHHSLVSATRSRDGRLSLSNPLTLSIANLLLAVGKEGIKALVTRALEGNVTNANPLSVLKLSIAVCYHVFGIEMVD